MTIKEIAGKRQVFVKETSTPIHESVFQSWHIVEKVIEMLGRGDSTQTVLEVIQAIREWHSADLMDRGIKNPTV
jgi:hypothetical protein